jgi:hypothetical protein
VTKVIFDISMSLDGLMTAVNRRPGSRWATAAEVPGRSLAEGLRI